MNIARTIKEARERLKISQAELGRRVGVSKQAVAKWEDGSTVPSRKISSSLARALGLSTSEVSHLAVLDVSGVDATKSTHMIPIMPLSILNQETFSSAVSMAVEFLPVMQSDLRQDNLVAVQVDRNDMAPEFRIGDVAILSWDTKPLDDDIVLALCGSDVILRRYKSRGLDSFGVECFDLISSNTDIETRTVNSINSGRVLAVVVEHHKKRVAR